MFQEREDIVEKRDGFLQNKQALVTVAVCAGLCVLAMNMGFLSLFFLVPLGYAILVTGALWQTVLAVAAGNIAVSLVLNATMNVDAIGFPLLLNFFYTTAVILIFSWIIAANMHKTGFDRQYFPPVLNLRVAYRFLLGAAAASVVFFLLIWSVERNPAFNEFLLTAARLVVGILEPSATDMQQFEAAQIIVDRVRSFALRGGALFSMLFLFFINYQITLSLVRFMKRRDMPQLTFARGFGFIDFFVPANTFWIFSGAAASVLLTRFFINIDFLNIIAWNILLASAVLFVVQGAGILIHLLLKCSNLIRFMIGIALFFLLISPFGLFIIVLILLLGIIENWLPIRRR